MNFVLTPFLAAFLLAIAPIGPPWISIEYPANPHDRTTKGAFLVVHAYHHSNTVNFPVSGTLEGIVNGKRESRRLEFAETGRAGAFALKKPDIPAGAWVMVIRVGNAAEGATALVELNREGQVASVTVPSVQRDGWTIPQPVSVAAVDALLQKQVQKLASAP